MIALPFVLNSLFNFAVGLLVARFLGAAEYGRYALALSIAVVIQTLALDWLRLSATRFYSEADRATRPEIRATLDLVFVVVTGLVLLAALAMVTAGIALPLSPLLVLLTVGVALANGLFEFSAALIRARFLNRAYGVLVIAKTGLSLVLAVGGAWWFESATAVLAGLILSIAGSIAACRNPLRDTGARPRHAAPSMARRYAAYALPIVLANVLYQLVPMENRAALAKLHGFAQAGQLALAFEMGIRIVGAIGSALDVLLFQLAVLAETTIGAAAGRSQVSRNMGLVFAIITPAVAGCWLVLPSFEHLLVPESFHGPFASYFTLMLPAMLAFALANYCVGPAFQIAQRTLPIIVGGGVAFAANTAALALLPQSADASRFALAQSISSVAGLATLLGFLGASRDRCLPPVRDILGGLAGTSAMLAAAWPLRALAPSWPALALQAGGGAAVYAGVALAFDVGLLRSMILARLKTKARDRDPAAPARG